MKDLEQRQLDLLMQIVRQYIRSGSPVGSMSLAQDFPLSSATIRHAMVLLEEEGYMTQPHTSAGRVPTPAAYRVYIRSIRLLPARKDLLRELDDVWSEDRLEFQERVKRLAKSIAKSANEVVFVAFDPMTVIVTGIKSLASKPEFEDRVYTETLAEYIDSLDEHAQQLYARAGDGPTVLVGGESGIPKSSSMIVTKYSHARHEGMIGMIGPLRMNYERNISLLQAMKDTIENEVHDKI